MAHLRRRDAWLRLVQLAVGTLLFFWPVVRLVNRRVDAAREMACDEWAVARGPLGGAAYARVLVAVARRAHELGLEPCAPAGALGMLGGAPELARRVDALLEGHGRGRDPRLPRVGAAALAGWTLLSLGGAAGASASPGQSGGECRFDPSIAEEMLASFPEADADGNGVLSRDEACAYQLRMKRRVVDEVFDRVAGAAPPWAAGVFTGAGSKAVRDRIASALPATEIGLSAEIGEEICCNCSAAEAPAAPAAECTNPED
jgi:hypothetical protein